MFKRILVALDGSTASSTALKSAIRLAKDQGATLVILHVVDDSMAPITFEGAYFPSAHVDAYFRALRESGQKLLDRAVAYARKAGATVDPAMSRTRSRTVAHAILAAVRKTGGDLIVLGTHGRRGLRRALMGSDAESVVRESTVPVLLLRAGIKVPKTLRDPAKLPRSSK